MTSLKKKKHGRQNFRWHPEINLSWDPSRKTRDPIRQFTSDHLAGFVVPSFDLSKWWTFIHDFYSKQSPTLWSRRAHRKMRFHHHITHLTKSRIFSDWKSASWLISLMIFRRVTIHRYLLIFPKENRGFQVFFKKKNTHTYTLNHNCVYIKILEIKTHFFIRILKGVHEKGWLSTYFILFTKLTFYGFEKAEMRKIWQHF